MKVIILSGAPGSGKSTIAKKQAASALVVSADDFFMKKNAEGKEEYCFSRDDLGLAHGECVKRFTMAIVNRHPLIVIDNTNIDVVDFAVYQAVARAFGYEVELLTVKISAETSFKRNLHNVPMNVCKNMCERLERRRVPKYWNIKEQVINNE